jgi:hypothetical protein
MDYHTPMLPECRPSEIFAEVRRVSDKDKSPSRRHSPDPYNLGSGWYHLSLAKDMPEFDLEAAKHVKGVWYTTFVKLRPEVEPALKQAILWPPYGLSLNYHPVSKKAWLTATGARCIGGCTVCYLAEPNDLFI